MDNENQSTAKDLFFETLDDTEYLLIMSYQIDLINEIPEKIKPRTLIICPENKITRLLKSGFELENIFQLPKDWNNYQEIHGKIFVQIKREKIIVFFGSNNFTYAGMCRNFETYCTFSSKLNIPISIENLKEKKDTSFWANCTDELAINSILDIFNHIFSNSNDEKYLAEEYFINTSLQSFFIHTAGKNTLLEGLKLGLRKYGDTERITIRIISPYTSAISLESFISFFWECLERPFNLEILTNYLPEFQNYYDSSGFIDPEQYENIKQEYKKTHNINIEMRFWSTEGIGDIPGNFIHSKLYFISSKTDDKQVFILSSANFTKTAWGLEDLKNFEIGYIEFQQYNSKRIYEFFNEFWKSSIPDDEQYLNKISKIRKKIVNKELISEVQFKEFFSKQPKIKGKSIKLSRMDQGYGFQKFLRINVPQEDYIEHFLKGTIKIILNEYSPEINTIHAEFHLNDITGQLPPNKLNYTFDVSDKNEYSLNLETVKNDIQINQNIDSIIIRAKTNISSNDIQIKTNNWEQIKSENIGDYSNKEIRLNNFSKYISINTTHISALLLADDVIKINFCDIDDTDIVIPIPKKVKIDQIKSIIIRQTQQDYSLKTILFYQPHLLFEEEPIKKISKKIEVIDGFKIQFLQIKVIKKWIDLDVSDFIFSYNGVNILPFCVSKKDYKDYSTFCFSFNNEFDILQISLHPIFKKYFKDIDKQFPYLTQQFHKKGMDELAKYIASDIVEINIKPNDPDETTPIKIVLKNNSKKTFGIEYKIIDGRIVTYKRPNIQTFKDSIRELDMGILKPGQILVYRPFLNFKNFRLFTQENKEQIIKNKLIDDINVDLPFKDHKRKLKYSTFFWTPQFFSIRLNLITKYNKIEKNIKNAKVIAEDKEYKFIQIKSNFFCEDVFYVFFRINYFADEEATKKILLYFNTEKYYSDFKKEIDISYEKTKDGIFIKVDKDQKFIENGDKQSFIYDDFTEVNFPLHAMNIQEKPLNMEFKKYEKELFLDSNELLTPIWFRGKFNE